MDRCGAGLPARLNLSLAVFYVVLNLFLFVLLPIWLLPLDGRWGWALGLVALLSNPFWSLIHEAIHDLLHPNRRINAAAGRVLSILFGAPFLILRTSHLLHHKLNRATIEGTEYYDRGRQSRALAAIGYYFQILGGLYLVEFLSPALLFFPRRALRAVRRRFAKAGSISSILMEHWSRSEAAREIRLDATLVVLLYGASLACYGKNWPLFVMTVGLRGFLISFLDNVYHYRTPVNDTFFASNLRLPRLAAAPLLHFNLHGVHHRNPSIPWKELPAAFKRESARYHGNYFAAAARQLAGPVALQDLPWAASQR